MAKSLAINEQHDIVKIADIVDTAMSVEKVLAQIALIQTVMKQTMIENEHYGIIPGTKKPTLLQPGAQKLCLTFRLSPDYEIIKAIQEKDFISYTMKCTLTHIPSGVKIAAGFGSCNSKETKYRYRYIEESTGKPIPGEYWKAQKAGDSKEMKRILGGKEFRAAKIDNQWVIATSKRIENDNPLDLDNTLLKMACKRSLVATTSGATAASDIFTQDAEDLPPGFIKDTHKGKKSPAPAKDTTNGEKQGGSDTEGKSDKEPPSDLGSKYIQLQAKLSGFANNRIIKTSTCSEYIQEAASIKEKDGYEKAIGYMETQILAIEEGR